MRESHSRTILSSQRPLTHLARKLGNIPHMGNDLLWAQQKSPAPKRGETIYLGVNGDLLNNGAGERVDLVAVDYDEAAVAHLLMWARRGRVGAGGLD